MLLSMIDGSKSTSSSGWCIQMLRRVITDLCQYTDGRTIGVDQMDAFYIQLELIYRELIVLSSSGEGVSAAIEFVRTAISVVESAKNDVDHCKTCYQAVTVQEGSCGRPSFHIW